MSRKIKANQHQNVDLDLVTIDEFLLVAGVKVSTVIKNRARIPGLSYEQGVFTITKGTRYPCDLHRYKIINSADRRFLLLKSISEYKFITHEDLRVYHEQFVEFLRELLIANLIKQNNLGNHFGANAYDCTTEGDKLLKQREIDAKKAITKLLAAAAGTLAGKVLSEVTP